MSWSGPFSYSWSPPPPKRRLSTSRTELLHLGIAYVVLTGCLLLVFSGDRYLGGGLAVRNFAGISPTLALFAALAALTGFVAHEMAHKIVAQRQGFWAEFRMSTYGLIMAVVTSVLGFIFAAPGATLVGDTGGMDRRSWGRTSLAGPMTNVAFAAIFYGASIAVYLAGSVLFVWLLALAFINAWFGTFNLFPFGVLDGRKVYRWDPRIWAGAIALTLAATILAALALYYFGTPLLSL